MKVLQLCKKSPTPQRDGESIAIHQVTKALISQGCQVDVLAMLTTKHPLNDSNSELAQVNYQYVSIDTSIRLNEAIFSMFGSVPYIVKRFYSANFKDALIAKLKITTYDVVLLEGVFLGLYVDCIKQYSKAKLVLRAHNIENQIWKRQALHENNVLKKAFLQLLMNRQFEQFELEIVQSVDGVISISPIDNQYFIENEVSSTLIMPVCVDSLTESAFPEAFQVGFLGGMDWVPNVQGVVWFIENVWLQFVEEFPDAEFNLAGRNFPHEMKAWQYPGIKVHGEIEDAAGFVSGQSLVIAPIFSGSGMRVKIIEAMSYGKCVLSTSIGAEGISCTDQLNILIADDATSYLASLRSLYLNRDLIERIGEEAALLVEKEYSLKKHAIKMHLFLQNL